MTATMARPMAGFGPLFRKELQEWRHGARVWVILAVITLFMTLSAANAAITAWIIANAPAGSETGEPLSLVPMDNILAAVSSQIFVMGAIFAAMSLLVGERERGTLSWVASKPVSRGAMWGSKWLAATAILGIVAGLLPLLLTFAVATALYGMPAAGATIVIAVGVVAAITFIVAVVLATSTVVSSQPAVAAIGFAVVFLPQILVSFLPAVAGQFLPTAILPWAIGRALGADVGFITPIAFAVSMAAVVAFATWRIDKLEL